MISATAAALAADSVAEWHDRNRRALATLAPAERGTALGMMLAFHVSAARALAWLYRAIFALAVALIAAALALGARDAHARVPLYVLGGTALHTLLWCGAAASTARLKRQLDRIAEQAARERRERGRR